MEEFLARIRSAPRDATPRLVLADWLDEQGLAARAAEWRLSALATHPGLMCWSGDSRGDGQGFGHGDGDGDGQGHGQSHGEGDSDGDGHGHGFGHGYSHGYGDGQGYGQGYGYGHGDGNHHGADVPDQRGSSMPIIGPRQIIVLGHGWVFVGNPTEQLGPYEYRIDQAVNICRTGGVPWDELIAGRSHAGATVRPHPRPVMVGPNIIWSEVWTNCGDSKCLLCYPNSAVRAGAPARG